MAVLAFVISDLLTWCNHWLHHHVATLWHFHAVHHSQTNLNVLSDNRQHFIETVIGAMIAYLPARVLGLDSPDTLRLAFLTAYWSALIHTNIRTDLGPLRYLVVSPQAHRVHHSVSSEHYDTNYGSGLACWDYLFHTGYRDHSIYPATGIDDHTFPELARRPNGRVTAIALAKLWVRQTVHPFGHALHNNTGYPNNQTTTAQVVSSV